MVILPEEVAHTLLQLLVFVHILYLPHGQLFIVGFSLANILLFPAQLFLKFFHFYLQFVNLYYKW